MKLEKLKLRATIIYSLILTISWIAFSAFFSFNTYTNSNISASLASAQEKINDELDHSQNLIDGQIKILKEQPLLIGQLESVTDPLIQLDGLVKKELNKEELLKDPDQHKVSLILERLNNHIGSNQIFLVNNHGYSIASSNWASAETSIGHNYKDRLNFLLGLTGKDSIQYAMGRTTHRAGLFFTHPIFIKNKFLGLLVIKHDLNNFLNLENHIETSILDQNNVVVATKNPELYLKSINYKGDLDAGDRFDRYLTYIISPLALRSDDKQHPELLKVGKNPNLYLKAVLTFSQYPMSLMTLKSFDEIKAIHSRAKEIFIFMLLTGLIIIFSGMFFVIYLSNLKILNKKLWFSSYHNPITGLPNNDQLGEVLRNIRPKFVNTTFFFYLLDVDDFRSVNRRLGRKSGDFLLTTIAERLRNLMPEDGFLFNNGIDKFSILCPVNEGFDDENFAASILDSLKTPFRIGNNSISMTGSLAAISFESNEEGYDSILSNAELILEKLKNSGGNAYLRWTEELHSSFEINYDIAKSLVDIDKNNQLVSVLQPIISLSTGKVVKAELLTRMMHPDHGLISPDIFIPLAERNGAIIEIGRYCRSQAIIYARRWRDIADGTFQISINKSSIELSSERSEASLNAFFNDIELSHLSGDNFCFELTENQLIEDSAISLEKLRKINEFGINLSVDDFGTGYSSIAYLKRFPISTIKLDISIVRKIKENSDSEVICASLIDMAHKLNLTVIAEGVETKLEQDLLIKMGCDYAQGFLYSRPIDINEFEKLLISNALIPFDVTSKSKSN